MTKMKKLLIAAVCLVAILTTAVVGTIAWLTDKTETITNTFSPSTIGLTLTEDAGGTEKTFKMVPGTTITKDPKVTVEAGSEACWLFVKIEKSTNFDSFMTYAPAEGWTVLDNGVYYRKVDAATATAGITYPVLTDNKVTVKDTVTEKMMESLTDVTKYPTLTFTAYAIQYAGFEENVSAAWAAASAQATN